MGCGSSKQPSKGSQLQDLAPRPLPGVGLPAEPELNRAELKKLSNGQHNISLSIAKILSLLSPWEGGWLV